CLSGTPHVVRPKGTEDSRTFHNPCKRKLFPAVRTCPLRATPVVRPRARRSRGGSDERAAEPAPVLLPRCELLVELAREVVERARQALVAVEPLQHLVAAHLRVGLDAPRAAVHAER